MTACSLCTAAITDPDTALVVEYRNATTATFCAACTPAVVGILRGDK